MGQREVSGIFAGNDERHLRPAMMCKFAVDALVLQNQVDALNEAHVERCARYALQCCNWAAPGMMRVGTAHVLEPWSIVIALVSLS